MTEKTLKKDQQKVKQEQTLKSATKAKEVFPEFPSEDGKESLSESSPPGSDDEEIQADEFLQEVCEDIVGAGFEVWSLANPDVKKLDGTGKTRISKPMSRIVAKYKLAKYMNDEFLFCTFLGYEIAKRIRIKKKNANHDSRKEGEREDHFSEELNQE